MGNNQENILKELKQIVGDESVITDLQTLKENSVDWIGYSRYEQYYEDYVEEKPMGVVKVHSTQEVSEVISLLNKKNVNIVPVTGKSCVTGGIITSEGGLVLDGSLMNEIVSFDTENFLVTAKCGTPLEYLEGYCNLRGYTTGHFPQSLPLAHLGGLVATRSCGQLSTLYGGIEDLLVGLEAVMPNGEIVRIKNVPRRATGPDLRHIFLGSEGALAYITEVTLKLFKLPADKWQCAYGVKNMDIGLEVIREIMQQGWKPSVVRLHDEVEAELTYQQFMEEGESLLILVAHGPEGMARLTGNAIETICENYDCRKIGSKLVDVWFEHRNDVAYNKFRHQEKGEVGESIEVSANWSDIGKIYKSVAARGIEEIDGVTQCSAHSSHSYVQGTNMYFVIRYKGSEDYRKIFDKCYDIVMGETLKHGGSIGHHHGVGKYRTKWMEQEHESSYVILEKMKEALDPKGIMNQATLLPKE
ncbi:MAG: FAD-binding oxidoreductase [Clostridia bacterium]|nr:FAD-binding oxidoreductase [Clostridia bacterium]